MLITSHSNAGIKRIRGLRARKEREESGLCFVEGIRLVVEATELGADFDSVIVSPELLDSSLGLAAVDRLEQQGVTRLEVSRDVFAGIASKNRPQGIAAVVRQRWERLDLIDPGDEHLWVVLMNPQDPGNVGSILRTSDAVGGRGVLLLGAATDPYDPVAIRASMGALFSQRLVRTSVTEFIAWKGRTSFQVIGTSDAAGTDYRSVTYRRPLMLMMGSEREGLPAELGALCDHVVAVPMIGRSDSLNLAVAAGVMLYEIFHQSRHND